MADNITLKKPCVLFYEGRCISRDSHYEGDPYCSPDCPHMVRSGKPPTEDQRVNVSLPVCPYCGHADREWWDAGEWDHNERGHYCPKCEKEYRAIMEPNPIFSTYPVEAGGE